MRRTHALDPSRRNRPYVHSDLRGSRRRAIVSVLVMLVLLLLAGLVTSQVRRVLMDRRQTRAEQLVLQAQHLVSAGLLRAEQLQMQQPEYTGETWEIAAGEIHQTNSASVRIEIGSDGVCKVVVRYPANADIPCQLTRIRKLSK